MKPVIATLLLVSAAQAAAQGVPSQIERLDRGTVAVPATGGGVHVSWRLLATDPPTAQFAVRRNGKRIATVSRSAATSFLDRRGTSDSTYSVAVGRSAAEPEVPVWQNGYHALRVDKPADRTTPDGERYGYTLNDASVGDLDGDGRYEIVVKWYPQIAKDNAFSGYTGETLIDAYTLDGKRLWRIDLGPNIRSGAHYTQFMVFDLDGDGGAELAMKTADGTVDGAGAMLGDTAQDWRSGTGEVEIGDRTGAKTLADGRRVSELKGRILAGPEYLTVFEGATGRAVASAPYAPARDPHSDTPTAAAMKARWGDGYGNRSERYLAGVAYLDGQRPSLIFARGYYGRSVLAAWDYRNARLTQRWLFDSADPANGSFGGQGNHGLAVADVDADGRDEIVYGAMAIDDDGKGLWSSGLGHGDAMHVSDLDPDRPGLERFGVHENMRMSGNRGAAMFDARTGEILWSTPADKDTGRGIAIDIDPRHRGAEAWSYASEELYDARGNVIPGGRPKAANFGIWWDGDSLRELLDGTTIGKWDWQAARERTLFAPSGVISNNGTKQNPSLSADILGDWREELILPNSDSTELRIYATPFPTARRHVTLMHDRAYRLAVAWQNTAYNQPPHTSFFLGAE